MYPVHRAGQRVTLREFSEHDLDQAAAIDGDDRVTHWLSFDPRTRDQTAAMLAGVLERAQLKRRNESLGVVGTDRAGARDADARRDLPADPVRTSEDHEYT
jgi:hypothetical protein